MMGGGTDWLTPALVLGVGLLAGIIFAIATARSRRAGAVASGRKVADHEDVRDLRAEKEALLLRLRDLEETSSSGRSQEQLAYQRYELELSAAGVLRELEVAEAAQQRETIRRQPAAQAAAAAAAQGNPRLTGALWGGLVVVFGGLLVFALLNATADRAPGGSLTGNTSIGPTGAGMGQMGGEMQPDPALEQLMAHVAKNPSDLEAHLDLAQAFIYRERLVDAFQVVQAANRIEAGHARALAYEAVVRQAMGMSEMALELLDAAVEKDPLLAEAWVRRGLSAFEMGRWQKAIDSWETALKIRPDGQSALGPVIEEAKQRLASGGEAPSQAGATPVAAAPAAAAPAAAAPAAAAPTAAAPADSVRLIIDLDPALGGKVPAGSVLFVYARPAGVNAGPPIAAKRIPATAGFPMELTLGPSDSMMGQPFPVPAMIEARLDADGNAMTRDPGDPRGAADGVSPGGDVLRLVLRAQ